MAKLRRLAGLGGLVPALPAVGMHPAWGMVHRGEFLRLVVPVTAPWRGTAGCHPRKVVVDAASGAWGLASIP